MEKLNVYLSNLAVLNAKFHNLHWNVVGKQFVQIHEFTESAYDSFFEQYDEVAELLKMRGLNPLVKLEDYLKNATVKEVASQAFSVKEVLDIVEGDFKLMMELATEIRNEADEANDFVVVAAFEGFVAGFQKNLWFIKAIKA
jgi:starvation-inducible DNA-binding protein